MVQPIRKQRLADQVAAALCEYVLERGLALGDRLPSEHDLAAAFAVSRASVREALRLLEQRGLIAVHHGQGSFLRARPTLGDATPPRPRTIPSDDVAEARSVFEAGLAELICARATLADVEGLAQTVAEMRRRVRAGSPTGDLDVAFHEQLLRCVRNAELIRLGRAVVLDTIRANLAGRGNRLFDSPEEVKIELHEVILTAVRARDAARLGRALRAHAYGRRPESPDAPGQSPLLERGAS